MNRIDIEEAPNQEPEQSFFQKHKKTILIVAGAGIAVIILVVVLSVVLTSKSSSKTTLASSTTTTITETTTLTSTTTIEETSTTIIEETSTTIIEETSTTTTISTSTRNPIIEKNNSRIDCLPWLRDRPVNDMEAECAKIASCKYQPIDGNTIIPSCFYDTDLLKLDLISEENTRLGKSYTLSLKNTRLTGDENDILRIDFEYLDNFALRVKIYKPLEREYEVPIEINKPDTRARNPIYDVVVSQDKTDFSFKVIRLATQTVIWDTSIGPIIFEKLHRQISTKLPTQYVYGFGENKHESFKHDLMYKNWPIFNRDEAPENVEYGNLYGSQPFYTCMEPYGKSHGVALVNSNALDYEFIPEPGLVYRATGGILDFYMFFGPEPENVIQQFTKYFGMPFMPPYWGLGFQISRYGYLNVEDMRQVLQRFQTNGIPLDTQVADIDHFDRRMDFTIDQVHWSDLPSHFDYLHSIGMKTVLILDPAIAFEIPNWAYTNAKDQDIFIKWPGRNPDFQYINSSVMVGYCWPPSRVAYPDFFKKSTQEWWINSILRHHNTLKFDGLWIDMNDPAVFGTNDDKPFNWPEDLLPYWSLKCPDNDYELVKTKASYVHRADNKLSDKTLCMTGVLGEKGEYKHFDVHNFYAYAQIIPTYEAARRINGNKRGFVLSRSTFLGSGKYGGHWTGDNHSLWKHLYLSIIGMLEFSLFGIPYVGADICGFWLNTTDQMCARWSSLGAFYPFSRNHNNEKNSPQDPGALSEDVISAAKKSLLIRYEILPYYYTLFYKAHIAGNTVARPMFHEFPRDERTYSIDKQFLIGPAFLVTPVLDENKYSVEGYLPTSHWYDFYDGKLIQSEFEDGKWLTFPSPIDHITLHIRGGYIIPTQEPANMTEYSRRNPFGLIIAMDGYGEAKGDLFYDDGDTDIVLNGHYYSTLSVRDNVLKMNIEENNYDDMNSKILNNIRIFVPNPEPKLKFVINNQRTLEAENVHFEANQIILSNLNLPMTRPFEIEWRVEQFFPANSQGPIIECLHNNVSITETECRQKGCMYLDNDVLIPKCFVPEDKGGYVVSSQVNGNEYHLVSADEFSLFADKLDEIVVIVSQSSIEDRFGMTRLQIQDKVSTARYQVPIKLNFKSSVRDHMIVNVKNSSLTDKAYIEVKNEFGKTVFDTMDLEHGFMFYDQFIQIVMNMKDYKNVYGFGESTHYSFKHKFSYTNWWGLFGRDQPPGGKTVNLYGTHPFFMAVDETTGRAFGALILNSNAQEYGLLPPSAVAYRTLGGVLDIYLLEESTPELLIQAYTLLIGTPYMPPYWSLGFQLCRYNYGNLTNLQEAVDRTLDAKIPLDIQYADIDHFYKQLDFTYDPVHFNGLPEYIKQLRANGIKFIIILDPAIDSEAKNYSTYLNGLQNDVYVKWPQDQNPQLNESITNDNPYIIGHVWPEGKAVFPDFFKNRTQQWWIDEIKNHYENELTFDGLWIDMNEPANFDTNEEKPWNWPADRDPWNLHCPNNKYDDPPYLPLVARPYGNIKRISDKTICMRGQQGDNDEYIHYDVHNLYGWIQTQPTLRALREIHDKRSIVITRSTFVSSGTQAGHWLGDNTSKWEFIKMNIIGLLEFNLFGIPYVGADICGFFDNTTPEMCNRWMQLGAFNPFFRNHNGFSGINQDPAALGLDVAASSRSVVELRYSLLPFLYSLFYRAHTRGGTVVRSLVHEFPSDPRTLDIDRQFMWGSQLLISPVVDKNTRSVFAYFPKARWFDYYTGVEILPTGRVHEIDAPFDHIPLHIRGGSIIMTQAPALNTELSRKNEYGLTLAPDYVDYLDYIDFDFYFDDGDSIDLSKNGSIISVGYDFDETRHLIQIASKLSNYKFGEGNKLNTIRILGASIRPNNIYLDDGIDESLHYDFEYNSITKELVLKNLGFDLNTAYNYVIYID